MELWKCQRSRKVVKEMVAIKECIKTDCKELFPISPGRQSWESPLSTIQIPAGLGDPRPCSHERPGCESWEEEKPSTLGFSDPPRYQPGQTQADGPPVTRCQVSSITPLSRALWVGPSHPYSAWGQSTTTTGKITCS